MAIRLSFDVIGSTCGDLLRFADAVRAAGIEPGAPLQQFGPNHIDVVDDKAQGPGPVPPFVPPPQHRAFGRPGPGYPMSGSFPPGPASAMPPYMQRPGCVIQVNWGNRTRETPMPIQTVGELHAILGRVLNSADLDETVRAALRNLREAFSDQETAGGS